MYVVQNRLLVMPNGYYKGIGDVFRKTYSEGGLKAFTGGYGASFVRIIPYKGIDMAGYSVLRDHFCPEGDCTTVQSLQFGAMASMVSQTVTHPLLVARTRLQVQGLDGRPVLYRGMVEALSKTYAEGGARALMGGWLPSMLKNVPAIAIQFAVCERMLSMFREKGWLG